MSPYAKRIKVSVRIIWSACLMKLSEFKFLKRESIRCSPQYKNVAHLLNNVPRTNDIVFIQKSAKNNRQLHVCREAEVQNNVEVT